MNLRLAWVGTYVQTQHDDHDTLITGEEIDLVHDQQLAISEARLFANVGITKSIGASLMLPVRVIGTSIRYLDGGGAQVTLAQENIHHRDETVGGIADPMVLGSVHAWGVTVRVGATLPLGRTEEDPFAAGDLGLSHQHIQLGTGTVNPVASIELARSVGAWRFGGYAFTQQTVYANGKGYQAGDRYAAGFAVRRRLGTSWSVRGTFDVQGETAERWSGMIPVDDGNRGRFDVIPGAGVAWAVTPELGLDLALKVPVVNYAVNGQLAMPAIVELGASWSFGAPSPPKAHAHDDDDEHEHEHEDEHGHDHDAPIVRPVGADIADVAAIAAVPGKLTIVDVWAAWCEPCKHLEPVLYELAAAYPDLIAIRRLDADTWSGHVDLPHVKIFDVTGALVLERSSGPGQLEALIAEVRAVVATAATRRSIRVTAAGFEPKHLVVPVGKPVTLRFEREVDGTCATEIVMTHEGAKLERALPLRTPVDLQLTFTKPGTTTYSCAMNMIGGSITAR